MTEHASILLTCHYCGSIFTVPRWRTHQAGRGIYCSQHCRLAKLRHGAPPAARFWPKVHRTGDCWTWQGARAGFGYGSFRFNGRTHAAHRVAWLLTYGDIPDGKLVLHHCDTPCCVRPDHLFLGSMADNVADMIQKGRARRGNISQYPPTAEQRARGARHGARTHPERVRRGESATDVRLTAEQVVAIRQRYAVGELNQKQLAHVYGVSHSNINQIITRRTWRHI